MHWAQFDFPMLKLNFHLPPIPPDGYMTAFLDDFSGLAVIITYFIEFCYPLESIRQLVCKNSENYKKQFKFKENRVIIMVP
ncbi:MAG TPA: hypothetical protein DD727_00940 [Clostridiales bacterium]|nr:hypothetical protein [Clostridiales bacterium]